MRNVIQTMVDSHVSSLLYPTNEVKYSENCLMLCLTCKVIVFMLKAHDFSVLAHSWLSRQFGWGKSLLLLPPVAVN